MNQSRLFVAHDSFDLPLTQELIGNALGLTPAHVNRTMKLLRASGMVALKNRRLTVTEPDGLAELADKPRYLHLRC